MRIRHRAHRGVPVSGPRHQRPTPHLRAARPMLREIVLDTETTGTEAKGGDRLIEIGAVELLNHIPTGRTFHRYCNPQRPVSEGAFNVHGLADAFLADKPTFAEVVGELLA